MSTENAQFPSCGAWPLSVCSWSLRTDVEGVSKAMQQIGVGQVNLALKPVFLDNGGAYLTAVRQQPWTISAVTIGFFQEDYSSLESIRATGGIVPDAEWERNREMVLRSLAITADLGLRFLSLHAGFIEEDDQAKARRIRDRLAELADAAAEYGRMLLMETGQETAASLRELLEDLNHPALGVNFDPANMILYGKGKPVEAVAQLGPWIRHVHVKDAVATRTPGTWGAEVPWGQGQVGSTAFLMALESVGYQGALAIEREAGDDRLGDIRRAAEALKSWRS
ncbi:MAG: sugar phosphate isomerase/epimerase [Kiritimatiellae bacterium]|nr:sugar phosphate isomerase/epimerase [Kiritimatiellia bacterium]